MLKRQENSTTVLLECLGISADSFNKFVSWALAEHLVASLAALPAIQAPSFFSTPDALKQFRNILQDRTQRRWSDHDLEVLYGRVKGELTEHYRAPIEYGEYLKLLWQAELRCVFCKRSPPEVVLHVDHVVPASKGGSSKRPNLQFLCSEHNLKKSNQREVTDLWLDLQ